MEDEMKNKADDGTKTDGDPQQRMITRPAEPRIPLLNVSALSQDQRAATVSGASNVLRMVAHRADLLAPWLEFGEYVTSKGRVPMRTRELVILRIALHAGSEYEWGNHVPAALSVGLTSAEIASFAKGEGSWSDAEVAALSLVDDLFADDCASEETWRRLSAVYDEGEIIELVMLIGFYRMNAGLLNSLGVPIEPGRPRLGQGMSYEAPVRQRPISTSTDGVLSEVKPDGTWHLKFYHPAATQELQLVIVMGEGGELSGSVANEVAGITSPISEGKIHERQVTFTTAMTKPYPVTILWDGTMDSDFIAGTAKISGMGSFPFDGTRIGER